MKLACAVLSCAVVFCALPSAVAFAADTPTVLSAGQPVKPDATAPRAEDEVVCRVERTLGSKMNKRVCRTRAEMGAESEFSRDQMGRMQRENGHTLKN